MSITPDPHDRFVRSSMENKAIAKAFFERHLPEPILSVLNTDSLKLEQSTYIDNKLQKTMSDMVFDCRYQDGKSTSHAKVVVLVEHQSTPQKLLPFRVYHYMFNMLYRELKQRTEIQASKPLPAIYALVFYNGKQSPYPYSLNLAHCFDDPHNLMEHFFAGEIQLVDVNQEKDQELKKLKWLGVVSLALKYSRTKDAATFLLMLSEILKSMDLTEPQTVDLLKTLFAYILVVSNQKNVDLLIEHSHYLPDPARGEFMTAAEQLEARGEARGVARGKAQGEKNTRIEVATSLLKEGAEVRFAAKISKLDLATIEKLKAQLDSVE